MANFTIELHEVIRLTGGEVNRSTSQTIVVGGKIGLEGYPIFDENYRPILTGKIVDHFWNREIAVETIDMFQLLMRRTMNEIMPLYNKLYLSEKIEFDPMGTVDLRTITTGEGTRVVQSEAESMALSNAIGKSRSVVSETPQTMLSGSGDYATNASDANSQSDSTNTGTQSGTDNESNSTESESHTTGYQGVGSELLMRYRDSLLNIDMNIITDLEDCFMQIWGTNDSYTTKMNGYY